MGGRSGSPETWLVGDLDLAHGWVRQEGPMRVAVPLSFALLTTLVGVGCGSEPPLATAPAALGYATRVVSFTKGEKGGFHEELLPGVVLGPPKGNGCCAGSLDVLSLGNGGEIVLAFDQDIVDGPGADFLVFENPFEVSGDPTKIVAEPAEVSVSMDGVHWTAFPCTATAFPYGTCAGWHPVYASPDQPLDPQHPEAAGGDPFDLATIGVSRARYLRIRDMNGRFPAAAPTAGFDLDAIAVLHASAPAP